MFIYYDVMCDYSQISVCPVSGDKTNIELGWAGLGSITRCWASSPSHTSRAPHCQEGNFWVQYEKK